MSEYSAHCISLKKFGDTYTARVEFSRTGFWPWQWATAWATYEGKKLEDGSILWKEDGDKYVMPGMEAWLNRRVRHAFA